MRQLLLSRDMGRREDKFKEYARKKQFHGAVGRALRRVGEHPAFELASSDDIAFERSGLRTSRRTSHHRGQGAHAYLVCRSNVSARLAPAGNFVGKGGMAQNASLRQGVFQVVVLHKPYVGHESEQPHRRLY